MSRLVWLLLVLLSDALSRLALVVSLLLVVNFLLVVDLLLVSTLAFLVWLVSALALGIGLLAPLLDDLAVLIFVSLLFLK